MAAAGQADQSRKLDKDVEDLHKALEKALGGAPPGAKLQTPYWDTSATDFYDEFAQIVDEWRAVDPDFPEPDVNAPGQSTARSSKSSQGQSGTNPSTSAS